LEKEATLIVYLLLAFGATVILTRLSIPLLRSRGIVGRDLHKREERYVVEMGGIGAAAAILLSTLIAGQGGLLTNVWPAAAIVAAMALIGIYDDFKKIRGRVKFSLTFMASLIVFYGLGHPGTGFVGSLFPSWVTPLVLALGVAVSANAVNILAGFNGLEAGTSAIAAAGFLVLSISISNASAGLSAAILLGACLGFLVFNKFPAKAFPGDVGTLTFGGYLAVVSFYAEAEVLLPAFLAPHLAEFVCKLLNRFKPKEATGHARLGPDGRLVPGPYAAVVHFVMRRFPTDEPGLVRKMWAIETLVVALSLAVYAASTIWL